MPIVHKGHYTYVAAVQGGAGNCVEWRHVGEFKEAQLSSGTAERSTADRAVRQRLSQYQDDQPRARSALTTVTSAAAGTLAV
ncbi:MAG: hypothetical protein QOJ13_961 [Gaiellales bacterium]|jgi:hypothetical protein|nr:hypothetical protein [Gaiellales bacterium]